MWRIFILLIIFVAGGIARINYEEVARQLPVEKSRRGDVVLKRAIQLAKQKNVATIFIPEGKRIILYHSVSIPSGIHIVSRGNGAQIILPATYSVDAAFKINNGKNITLQNLTFLCDSVSRNMAILRILGNEGNENILIQNCRFQKKNLFPSDIGIYLSGTDSRWNCQHITIENCQFQHLVYGIRVNKKAQFLTITGNTFRHVKKSSIDIQGDAEHYCQHILIEKNNFAKLGGIKKEYTGHPIRFSTAGTTQHVDARVLNNTILGNLRDYKEGGNADMIAFYDCTRGVVSENYVFGGGDVGIALWRTSYSVVTNNITESNNSVGIALDNAHDNLIANNMVLNNNIYASYPRKPKRGGIYVWRGSTNNYITGNKCLDTHTVPEEKTQQYGILIWKGNSYNRIGKNDLRGNRFGEIYNEEPTTIIEQQ